MSNSDAPIANAPPVTYRQRFTEIGHVEIGLAVLAPAITSYFLMSYLDYSYDGDDLRARTSGIIALFFSVSTIVGWIMILVGREYYPYQSPGKI